MIFQGFRKTKDRVRQAERQHHQRKQAGERYAEGSTANHGRETVALQKQGRQCKQNLTGNSGYRIRLLA
jgi:hypothetical protein